MRNDFSPSDDAFGHRSGRTEREFGHGGHGGRGGFRGPRGGFEGFGAGLPGFMGGFGGPGEHGFGRGPRARRGDVRSAILGLLAENPSNGYALIKAIGEKTDGAWQPSPGSVYPTLAQLVDEGLIVQSDGAKGAYSLTDSGRDYVTAHGDEIAAALDGSRGGMKPGDDEMFAAFRKLVPAAMQFRTNATAEQRAAAATKIDDLRRELYRMLAE